MKITMQKFDRYGTKGTKAKAKAEGHDPEEQISVRTMLVEVGNTLDDFVASTMDLYGKADADNPNQWVADLLNKRYRDGIRSAYARGLVSSVDKATKQVAKLSVEDQTTLILQRAAEMGLSDEQLTALKTQLAGDDDVEEGGEVE